MKTVLSLLLCMAFTACEKPAAQSTTGANEPAAEKRKLFYDESAVSFHRRMRDMYRKEVDSISDEMRGMPPGGDLELLKIKLSDRRGELKRWEESLAATEHGHEYGYDPDAK